MNQSAPTSLSDGGKLHTCTRSHLADILQVKGTLPEKKPESDVFIGDGSAMVNTLPPHSSKTFDEYAINDTLPRIET